MTTPVLLVTGTDTEVGKTITTAAIAAALAAKGQRVLVVKVAQTGVTPTEEGDAQTVARLAGVTVDEYVRLPDPLAPDVAAALVGAPLPDVTAHADRIAQACRSGDYDVVLVEGSGGLLVHLDSSQRTLADLGIALSTNEIRCGFIVVARAGLGTLNHTALTLEALQHRGLDLIGVVIGSAPTDPGLAETTNVDQLRRLSDGQLLGSIPADAGSLDADEFRRLAPSWIAL